MTPCRRFLPIKCASGHFGCRDDFLLVLQLLGDAWEHNQPQLYEDTIEAIA